MLIVRLFFYLTIISFTACASKKVAVIPYLVPTETATLEDLVETLNQWEVFQSLLLQTDLQFQTFEPKQQGESRQFRTAQGRILLERPQRIRLEIEAPILNTSLAEMVSDGEQFQLLIYPREYRALIEGHNESKYETESSELTDDPALQKAGPLINIRPQHITDAFLLPKIKTEDEGMMVFLNEERIEEFDKRQSVRKGPSVRKSYYVVTVVKSGQHSPSARYWFDRIEMLKLARQQRYDSEGHIVASIRYDDYFKLSSKIKTDFPSTIQIERPYDNYTITVKIHPDRITVNRSFPDRAFVINPPTEWGDTLRRFNLATKDKPMF